MSRFLVSFDHRWPGTFDNVNEAITYAKEASDTGRMTGVVERRWWHWDRLVTAFPEEKRDFAEASWRAARGARP